MGVFSCVAVRSKAGQTVVGDLQDKAVVDDTVGRLEFTVREDDTVVEEQHALQTGGGGAMFALMMKWVVGCPDRGGRYLDDVVDERILEHPVQSDAVVLQDVLRSPNRAETHGQVSTGGQTGRDRWVSR